MSLAERREEASVVVKRTKRVQQLPARTLICLAIVGKEKLKSSPRLSNTMSNPKAVSVC